MIPQMSDIAQQILEENVEPATESQLGDFVDEYRIQNAAWEHKKDF
ncbi:hypothetical protein HMPREF3227_00816 [Corynebacterium sp. CMW7794]|nr:MULTISPECIES: hypothetical protein [Corynebacterium]KXB56748.1 hypothetical protein HMPREF0307_00063 [Corynebacterium sp. DNF00584]KXI18906.1 hypothetical protein HMPREF3227_00816 [Corynebacterium sp. CMW7794]MBF9011655.1 hypothetical protein [Corynebacterium phoceense]